MVKVQHPFGDATAAFPAVKTDIAASEARFGKAGAPSKRTVATTFASVEAALQAALQAVAQREPDLDASVHVDQLAMLWPVGYGTPVRAFEDMRVGARLRLNLPGHFVTVDPKVQKRTLIKSRRTGRGELQSHVGLSGVGPYPTAMVEVKIRMEQPPVVEKAPAESVDTLAVLQEMVDNAPIRRMDPLEEKLQKRAIDAVLNGTAWMTSKEVGARVDPTAANKHAQASRWLREKRIFAIERANVKEFPSYAFDPLGNPVQELREILAILDGYSPFRVASWFESTSSQLDGRRPRELLGTNPAAVIEAARAHVQGPVHG